MNTLHTILDAIERRRLRWIAKRRLHAMLRRNDAVGGTARREDDPGRPLARRLSAVTFRTRGFLDRGPRRLRNGHATGMEAMRRLAVVAGVLGSAATAWPLGDVQVFATDGELAIVGDDSPNEIEVSAGADTGEFVVTGIDGTAINGGTSAAVTGVQTIRINMKAGQDSVALLEVDVADKLLVKLGPDRDTFMFDGGRVRGKLRVNGGGKAGDDLIVQGGARIGGRLVLATGNKRDTITVSDVSIGRGLDIRTGAGSDYILVEHAAVDSDTDVDTDSGNDRMELVDVDFEEDLDVDLGDGDDDVRVEDCDFDGEIDADGGDGDDELALSGDNTFNLQKKRSVRNFEDFD
jgi:hypothetical protein